MTSPSSAILSRLRREFEIPVNVSFLNNASFGPVPRRGRLAIEELIRRQGQFRGDPNVDDESYAILEESRRLFAQMIGQDYRFVSFAPNATSGINSVLLGLSLKRGDRIAVPRNEFPAATYAIRALAESVGVELIALQCPDGQLSLDELEAELKAGASVFILSWVQYYNGYRNNLQELTALCHAHGCVVIVDVSQGAGAIPLNMRRDGFDALAGGAQKWLLGQTGAGWFANAKDPIRPITPVLGGWMGYDWNYTWGDLQRWDRPRYRDGRMWEAGTYPYFSLRLAHAGLSILSTAGVRNVYDHVQKLLQRLADALTTTRYRVGIFPRAANRSCIVAIHGPRVKELHQTLYRKRIYTSFREGNIRVSPHFYNTDADIDRLSHEIIRFDKAAAKR